MSVRSALSIPRAKAGSYRASSPLMKATYRSGLLPLIAAKFVYAPLDATTTGATLGLLALVLVWAIVFGGYLVRFLKADASANGTLDTPISARHARRSPERTTLSQRICSSPTV